MQLDSISTVDRAHRLTLTARIGAYPRDTVPALLRAGRVFEYWAHEASLLPIELWPHFRAVMDGGGHWGTHDRALREHADLVEPVLDRIRDEGPLGSRDFDGRGGGGMWDWKPAKMVLDALWDKGVLVIAERRSFQRAYDLAERVIPKHVLEAPTPTEDETLRTLALLAVGARGALTEPAIREHWRLKGGKRPSAPSPARPRRRGAAARGRGRRRRRRRSTSCRASSSTARLRRRCSSARSTTCVWDRPLLERLFGFRHVIEVYKREHERAYGYYVLPLLAGDRFLGRADLKADRAEGVLRVRRFTPEPRVRGNIDSKLDVAATRLARMLGLERVERAA